MEWKQIIEKINKLKETGDSFINLLEELEKVKAEPQEKIFIYTTLSLDYDFYDEVEKSELYSQMSIEEIDKYIQNNVLGTRELIYLVDLLEKCYLNLLKHNSIDKEEILKIPQIENIKSFGNQLFFFFLSKGAQSFENILFAAHFMNIRLLDHLKELFDYIFTFYDDSYLIKTIETIQSLYAENLEFRSSTNSSNSIEIYGELIINFLVLEDLNYNCYIENVRNLMIAKKNNLQDLYRIFFNCLRLEKYELIGKILESFLEYKEVLKDDEVSTLSNLLTQYAKTKHNLNPKWVSFVDVEEFLKFLFRKKMYSKVIEIYEENNLVSLDYAFCSYIELNRVEKAKDIFEVEQVSRYGLDFNKESIPLSEEYIFRLHLKTKNNSAACNILQSIRKIEKFIDFVQIIYAENDFKLLIEAIYIGIERFKATDFKMLQVFISLLHIEKFDILVFDRANMILKMIKILDMNELSKKQKEWLAFVCFNNVIDLIDIKCAEVIELSDTMIKLELDVDSIYLCLCVYSRKNFDINEYKDRIERLYSMFGRLNSLENSESYYKTVVMFYKCYSLMNDNLSESIFNILLPFKKLNNDIITLLLNLEPEIINKMFDRKISIIKEAERRNLLGPDTIYAFISSLSIQGPHASLLFLEKLILYIEIKYLQSFKITNIVMNQKSLLEIIEDKISVNRINCILEQIES